MIGGGVALVLVVGVVYSLKNAQLATFLDGESEKISRGDLVVPVNSSGTVEPDRLVEIKPKASGEVKKLLVVEGQMVREGDLLVELDPVDETRNVERFKAAMERAEANLEKAINAQTEQGKTLPLNTSVNEARVRDAAASLLQAETDYKKTKGLFDRKEPVASEQEYIIRKAQYERAQALHDQAKCEHERAKVLEQTVLKSAAEDVRLARAARDEAYKQLEEGLERLKETKVTAPIAGMVYSVRVRPGEVIQSGKTSLTGGTALLYIADVGKMVVMAQVDEADIGAVRRVAPAHAQPGNTRPMTTDELFSRAGLMDTSGGAPAAIPAPAHDEPESGSATTRETPAELRPLVGGRVRVTVDAYRSEVYEGVIERILPEPRSLNNVVTFNVRIVLVGEKLQKLLGLQSEVEFTADKVENVLRVKNEAIVSEGRESFVYVPHKRPGSSRLTDRKVPVKIGMTDGIYTEIRSGLEGVDEVWVKRPRMTDREKEEQEKS